MFSVKRTLAEIAQVVGGQLVGEAETSIRGVSGIREAQKGEITFLANTRYESLLSETDASAVLLPEGIEPPDAISVIYCEDPSIAFAKVVELFSLQKAFLLEGIHPTSVIHKTVELADDVAVGPNVVIEERVSIGSGAKVCAGSYLGHNVKIGKGCLIYPNVTILCDTLVGNNVIIHSGTVIGSDGFGYVTDNKGKHKKIPQVGIVDIGDDVEIGSNVSIDRARFNKTTIGRGSKIDNLVQIAHNVTIGADSIIVAQVGISGSTRIGKNVILAGQVGIVGHIEIGDGAIVAAKSGVSKNIKSGETMFGYPAVPIRKWKRQYAQLQRMPELSKRVKELEKKVRSLLEDDRQSEND
ncbi:MAG: UDP-3-O-(3-hydroxymyristoyl)glucosamine N-acyltransferase [Candidatus Theseobacter exili]|nr:UDP-3-O-(3-hydroxymyristoyl)glucosamine N-acyltransferase [Candidatus Theseobacter exili]